MYFPWGLLLYYHLQTMDSVWYSGNKNELETMQLSCGLLDSSSKFQMCQD